MLHNAHDSWHFTAEAEKTLASLISLLFQDRSLRVQARTIQSWPQRYKFGRQCLLK